MTRSTPKRSSARLWTERILLLVGIAGLGVWLGTHMVFSLWQAWESQLFDRELQGGEVYAQPSREKHSSEGAVVGRLTIPRLSLSAMVREGDGENTLSLALGHVPGTALPGHKGNVAVAGHRDTIFRSLRGIRKYDLIRFETLSSGSYLYEVSSIEVVEPTDLSVLQPSRNSELTLVTCYPFYYIGSAPQRFIVKAREVDRAPRGAEQRQISRNGADPPQAAASPR